MISRHFDVTNRARSVFQNPIHIELAFAVRRKCVVMAVEQKDSAGGEARRHADGLAVAEPDENEALPAGAVAYGRGAQAAQKGFAELDDFVHVHSGDESLGGSDGGVGEDDVFKFVAAGRDDGGAFVDFGGIEQVEHREALHLQDPVHAFQTEAALAVEKVGDVGLLESGLLGQVEAGEFAGLDPLPENFAKILPQRFELHARSIAHVGGGADGLVSRFQEFRGFKAARWQSGKVAKCQNSKASG